MTNRPKISDLHDDQTPGIGDDGQPFPVQREGDPVDMAEVTRLAEGMFGRLVGATGESDRANRTLALQPYDKDYPRVFAAALAAKARRQYAAMWVEIPTLAVPLGTRDVRVVVATSDALAAQGAAAVGFPADYDRVAPLLGAGVAWACCFAGGQMLEGFAYMVRRWAWFPAPWQLVG